MKNFVIINGVNSNTINGLGINELPPISKPSMRVLTEEIDGRDGDITTNLGYSAYDKTITIGLFGTGYDINNIISFFNGEGTIVFSNEDDKYYKYKIINQIDYEALLKFKQATITFHCQPFKYPLTETPLEIEYDYIEQTGETLTLNNTGESILDLSLKGNTSQTGTPTPSSPIPINVVSGDNEVVVCGKNIMDNTIASTSQEGTGEWTYLPAGTYYAKRFRHPDISADTHNSRLQIILNGTLTNIVQNATIDNGDISISGTDFGWYSTGATATLVLKKGYNIRITGLDYFDMMVQKTNDITEYEPYQSQTYPINLGELELCKIGDYQDYFTKNSGKNLLPNERATTQTQNNMTYTNNGDGTITLNGTTNAYTQFLDTNSFTLEKGTYTLWSGLTSSSSGLDIQLRSEDGLTTYATTNTLTSFTLENDTNVKFRITISQNSTKNNLKLYPMVVKGTYTLENIGTYEPYGTGQWCKYNAIGKVVLDGTNVAFTYESQSTLPNSLMIPASSRPTGLGDVSSVKCSHFSNIAPGSGSTLNTLYWGSSTQMWLCKDGFTSLSAGNTWLQSNNVEIYYVLATPYLSLIEDTTLISQLDNIQNAMSYEGQTNIGQVNNDKPFVISAKALEQGSDEVVVNNIGNATSKPLIALEGTGNINIYLDGTQVLQANVEDKMNIDIDKLEAYNPDTSALLNRQVTGNYNSMTLPSGNSTIKIDGALDKATITNYQRWL